MATFLPKAIRRGALRALLLAPALAAIPGCTDLTEVPRDRLTTANAFKTDDEVFAGVTSVYAGLRGMMWGYFNLSEVSTDEVIVPTRGSDWFDNGRWLEIYRQGWAPNSGSALDDMNGTWNDLYSGVAKANLMIEIVNGSTSPNKAQFLAELRTLRAWYYYMLQDMFGGVPLVTTTQVSAQPKATRKQVFDFIEKELNESRTALPEVPPLPGRVTRGVADAMLASLYLNAQVFGGEVTPGGLTPGAAKWAEAAAAADRVINSGRYQMATTWRNNFAVDNDGSPENIFYVSHAAEPGLGMTLPMRTLHYNQLAPGPWNGFTTIAETYRAFDADDARRSGTFLIGQQFSYNTGEAVNDRAGAPLIFTDTIADATKANENEGPRFGKFPPQPNAPDGNHPNNFPIFRLAEMYLIKAEALNEQGSTGEAIQIINERIRSRVFDPPKPLNVGMSQAEAREAILRERLFEFTYEAKRRQDLIRAGRYTAARRFKPDASAPYKILMPIPQTQISNNPRLVQNPGY